MKEASSQVDPTRSVRGRHQVGRSLGKRVETAIGMCGCENRAGSADGDGLTGSCRLDDFERYAKLELLVAFFFAVRRVIDGYGRRGGFCVNCDGGFAAFRRTYLFDEDHAVASGKLIG